MEKIVAAAAWERLTPQQQADAGYLLAKVRKFKQVARERLAIGKELQP